MADLKGLSVEELETALEAAKAKVTELRADEKTSAEEYVTWVDELSTSTQEVADIKAELATRKELKEKADAALKLADDLEAEEKAEADAKAKAEEEEAARIKAEEEKAAAEAEVIKAAEEAAQAEAEKIEEETEKISLKDAEVPEAHKPQVKEDEVEEKELISLVAAADVPNVSDGSILSMKDVSDALISRRKSIKNSGSDGEFVLVASADADYEDARTLTGDFSSDQEKIRDVAGVDAIVASGGICAPTEAWYGLELLSEACRPVKEALPGFAATRGGVRYMTPPSLADVVGSARITTEAEDAAGYNTDGDHESLVDPKPSVHVACGQINEVVVDAISSILTVGNMNARTYPELVETWTKLAAAQHAKIAEVNLLDKIGAASTAVTSAKVYGATRSILSDVDRAIAGYKSRHRICNGVNIRVMFPDWVKNLLRVDLTRQATGDGLGHFYVSDGQLNDWFTARGVSVTYYRDSQTGAGQSYGAQSAGALTDFPGTVVWYLFAEGTFIFLDGGTLDLGLVRDSTLNSINDYSLFVETFENLAFVGHEALKITSTVEPDGSGPTGATITG